MFQRTWIGLPCRTREGLPREGCAPYLGLPEVSQHICCCQTSGTVKARLLEEADFKVSQIILLMTHRQNWSMEPITGLGLDGTSSCL